MAATCDINCGAGVCTEMALEENGDLRWRCQCPLGKSGDSCEEDVDVRYPSFRKSGWLQFHPLTHAYEDIKLVIEIYPYSGDGLILYDAESLDLSGDYIALLLNGGRVEFRFDCGSGPGSVVSPEKVILNQWNKISIYRHRWSVWMQLNNGNHSDGRSEGLFSRITFQEPLYVGGSPNMSTVSTVLNISIGFEGCIRMVDINDQLYDFRKHPHGHAVHGFDVDQCKQAINPCSLQSCENGGDCITIGAAEAKCICPIGFQGESCEEMQDLEVPSFNGTSYLKFPGLGTSVQSHVEIQLSIKPRHSDGILMFNGEKETGQGDFIAIVLTEGHPELLFDLGNGPVRIRSPHAIPLDEWSTVTVSRTGRLGTIKVNQQPLVTAFSNGAFTELVVPYSLYLGGISFNTELPPLLIDMPFYSGCLQKLKVNKKEIDLLAAAMSGHHIGNCDHPCSNHPCQHEGICVPRGSDYYCNCDLGFVGSDCSVLQDYQTTAPMFFGNSFLHFSSHDVMNRMSGRMTDIEFRFKTLVQEGLLFYTGSKQPLGDSDFLQLSVKDGYAELKYNLGSGAVSLVCNQTFISDGEWHHVRVQRYTQEAEVVLDHSSIHTISSPGLLQQLDVDTGLYIGGLDEKEYLSNGQISSGFVGCMADLVVGQTHELELVDSADRGQNIDSCYW